METLNYILTDHLGSITNVLDESGGLLEEQNFDAWGRHRNPQTWSYTNVPATHLYSWGFTGHEHLDAFKLIDMKGRMYDPVTARFLSLDPVVQHTDNSQSYNRYSYALNNPLKYTDPTGYFNDWFINQFTGDVYYNSTLGKGDAGKIEGEGWEWFGEDNVFGMSPLEVVRRNRNLMYSTMYFGGNEVEATFKGQKATTFMKGFGYRFEAQSNESMLSEMWNSTVTRAIISDFYSVGLSSEVSAFLGFGMKPVNFTLITRGDPGLYFTPALNISAGDGLEMKAGVAFSKGWYTGDPRKISYKLLSGFTFGYTGGAGLGPDASVGISYTPGSILSPFNNGIISINGMIGVGIEGGATGVNIQVNGEWVPVALPVYRLK